MNKEVSQWLNEYYNDRSTNGEMLVQLIKEVEGESLTVNDLYSKYKTVAFAKSELEFYSYVIGK